MVLSSQMLHALRMTSFWSPHMPADPPPCSKSSLTRARVPAVVPSLTGLHSSLQICPLIGGHQRSLPHSLASLSPSLVFTTAWERRSYKLPGSAHIAASSEGN